MKDYSELMLNINKAMKECQRAALKNNFDQASGLAVIMAYNAKTLARVLLGENDGK
jgi:hypothetical protein